MSIIRQEGEISVGENKEIEWTLKDIFSTKPKREKRYRSPPFTVDDTVWNLGMYLSYFNPAKSPEGEFSFYLHRRNEGRPPQAVTFTLGMRGPKGTVETFGWGDLNWVFELDYNVYGWPKCVPKSDFSWRKPELAPSDDLRIGCTMKMVKSLYPPSRPDLLSQSFADLVGSDSDVTLRVMKEEFLVHRSVLESKAPNFAVMYLRDLKAQREGYVVDIYDQDPSVFRDFLWYLYLDRIGSISKSAMELYELANTFGVEKLKLDCIFYIMTNLKVEVAASKTEKEDEILKIGKDEEIVIVEVEEEKIESFYEAVLFGLKFNLYDLLVRVTLFFRHNRTRIMSTKEWILFRAKHEEIAQKLLKDAERDILAGLP